MCVSYHWGVNSSDTMSGIVPAHYDHLPCPWLIRVELNAATAKWSKQRASDEVAAHSPLLLSLLMRQRPGYKSCLWPDWSQVLSAVCGKHRFTALQQFLLTCFTLAATHDVVVRLPPDTYRLYSSRLFTCYWGMQDKEREGRFFSLQSSCNKSVNHLDR